MCIVVCLNNIVLKDSVWPIVNCPIVAPPTRKATKVVEAVTNIKLKFISFVAKLKIDR